MHPPIAEYLGQLSLESRERLASHFKEETEEFIFLSEKLGALLKCYHEKNQNSDDQNPRQVALALMMRGASTLMAAFELTITGYVGEPEILLRSALERFSVAWDVVSNPERFTAWKKGDKFDSTNSISRAKEAIGPIGKIYGYLSNIQVHITPLNSSPSMFLVNGVPEFQLYGYLPPGKENVVKSQIYVMLFHAYISLRLAEVVFHNYGDVLETVERIPGENLVRSVVSARHQRFVDAGIEQFRLMATDPGATLA
jgi:hypothetical protein